MRHADKFSPTSAPGHKFDSPEMMRDAAEELETPISMPIGREAALQRAGLKYRDAFFDMAKILLHKMRRMGAIDPASIKEEQEIVNLMKASCPNWAREAGI